MTKKEFDTITPKPWTPKKIRVNTKIEPNRQKATGKPKVRRTNRDSRRRREISSGFIEVLLKLSPKSRIKTTSLVTFNT